MFTGPFVYKFNAPKSFDAVIVVEPKLFVVIVVILLVGLFTEMYGNTLLPVRFTTEPLTTTLAVEDVAAPKL